MVLFEQGSNNPNWKGYAFDHGYLMTKSYNHPFRDNQNYVKTHRLVYEHYLKILFDEDIFIPSEFDIHHIDNNKLNNSLINLIPVHHNVHNKKNQSDRYCKQCGSKTTFTEKGKYPHWHKYKNGFICNRCYIWNRRH